jgi:hypothetical protein
MAFVTVACKLPNGLIAEFGDKRVTFNGVNKAPIIGGFGKTEGVDKEWFEGWLAEKLAMGFKPVINGLIFADEKEREVLAEAKDKADKKTGFEKMPPKAELTPDKA